MFKANRSERSHRRHRGRRRSTLAAIAVFAAILWSVGLLNFASTLPEAASPLTAPLIKTGAIVVLTGGSGRLEAGFTLLEQGRASRLYVSGVYKGVEVAQLLRLTETAPEGVRCCVELGHEAESTYGNAIETAAWMKTNRLRSVLLVTARYHMPRSLLEFAHAMPDRTVVPYPVRSKNVIIEKWWAWPGTLRLIATEYTKYLAARVRIALTDAAIWVGLYTAEDSL